MTALFLLELVHFAPGVFSSFMAFSVGRGDFGATRTQRMGVSFFFFFRSNGGAGQKLDWYSL